MSSTPSPPGPDLPDGQPEEVVDGQAVDDHPQRRQRPTHGRLDRLDVRAQESRYVSELPAPDDLERYARLVPDIAERLVAASEREQTHRHQIENRLAAIDEAGMPRFYAGQRRGQLLGFTMAVAYIGLMMVIVLVGAELAGAGGAALGLAAVIWALRRDPAGLEPGAPIVPQEPGAEGEIERR